MISSLFPSLSYVIVKNIKKHLIISIIHLFDRFSSANWKENGDWTAKNVMLTKMPDGNRMMIVTKRGEYNYAKIK